MKRHPLTSSACLAFVVLAVGVCRAGTVTTPAELSDVLQANTKVTGGAQLSIKGMVQVSNGVKLEIKSGINVEAIPSDETVPQVRLVVDGEFKVDGKDQEPVMFRGWYDKMVIEVLPKGRMTAKFAYFKDMDITVKGGADGGVLELENCILDNVTIRFDGKQGGTLRLKNCRFENNLFDVAVVLHRYQKGPAVTIQDCVFADNKKGAIMLDGSQAIKSARVPVTIKNNTFKNNGDFNLKLHDSKDITLAPNFWGSATEADVRKTIVVVPKDDRPGRIHFSKGVLGAEPVQGPALAKHPMMKKQPKNMPPNFLRKQWVQEKLKASGEKPKNTPANTGGIPLNVDL